MMKDQGSLEDFLGDRCQSRCKPGPTADFMGAGRANKLGSTSGPTDAWYSFVATVTASTD